MKKIVITGPESTGKSTLANTLAKHYGVQVVPEFAVEYLTNTNGKYDYRDLLKIAQGQIEIEENIINKSASNLLICDTDLITIKIWSKVKYTRVSRKIMHLIKERKYDYYLLCKPDIPWIYDKFRENPNDRDWLFTLYEKELIKYGKNYSIIGGHAQKRLSDAVKIINSVI